MEIRVVLASELDQAWELEQDCFHVPASRRELFLRDAEGLRLIGAFERGRLCAMAGCWSMGQYFGGRAVAMGGLASVAVAADRRGEGLATQLTRASLHEMRERGECISSLYPAATGLYRALGWELAGSYVWQKLAPTALHSLPLPARKALRPAAPAELDALRACYERAARRQPGFLARSDAWWQRLSQVWKSCRIHVAETPSGDVEGYVVSVQQGGEYSGFGGPFRIAVRELIAESRDAALSLWRLLGSWSTQVSDLILVGPVAESLLLLSPEQAVQTLAELRWMTRIVDAPAAIAARGFPEGLDVEVSLALRDATLAQNDGAYVLRVRGGHGELARGGSGALRLSIGGFAALYTGFASTARLARGGLLEGGSDPQRDALDAAFAGAPPSCAEEF